MPNSCFAPACSNRKSKRRDLSFYRLPSNKNQRELWLRAIRRDKIKEELLVCARLCSEHFISGKSLLSLDCSLD